MAILAPDYNPTEVTMFLKKKNPNVKIELEIVNGENLLHCNCSPRELILPRGWKIKKDPLKRRISLTNYSKNKVNNIHWIYFCFG